jgi:hypothetical protein
MNQEPFGYALTSMAQIGLNVPVFSSYVNADVTVVDHYRYNPARPIFVNAWLDIVDPAGFYGFSAEYWAFVATMTAAGYDGKTEGKANYTANNFAIAGYIAGMTFVAGLQRLAEAEVELTWANFIAQMESAPVDIPMGGFVDFSGGKRWGINEMALVEYRYTLGDNPATTDVVETDFLSEKFVKVRDIEHIDEIME